MDPFLGGFIAGGVTGFMCALAIVGNANMDRTTAARDKADAEAARQKALAHRTLLLTQEKPSHDIA